MPKLAQLFAEHLYRLYGLPTDIVLDKNRKFNIYLWQAIFKQLDTHHLESDGQIERVNQILEDILQAYEANNNQLRALFTSFRVCLQ